MAARALVTQPGSREAPLATLMLCSDGSRDVHGGVSTVDATLLEGGIFAIDVATAPTRSGYSDGKEKEETARGGRAMDACDSSCPRGSPGDGHGQSRRQGNHDAATRSITLPRCHGNHGVFH